MAALSVLALLALGLVPCDPAEVSETARLAVRSGRAELVHAGAVATLTRASGARAVAGAAYVELGPGAELEVSWPGSASLRVRGPAAFEWGPGSEVRVLRAQRIEAEVRRGTRVLRLSDGWSLALGRGAVAVAERPSGDLVAEHRGGADVLVQRGGADHARLRSGRSLVLPARGG